MADAKTYRPNLLKPDFSSAYFELSGITAAGGVLQGDGLVKYVWRYFDILEDTEFPHTLELIQDELEQVLTGTKWAEAKGLLFQFDILETGTTTFGEVFIDLEDLSTRQVLYSLRSREVRDTKITDAADLINQLAWMPANFQTDGIAGLAQISLVTYKRFDDTYDG